MSGRFTRVRGPDTDVLIDHQRRHISGWRRARPPGPCPHSHVVYAGDGGRSVEPCTGQEGHLSRMHADRDGRQWK